MSTKLYSKYNISKFRCAGILPLNEATQGKSRKRTKMYAEDIFRSVNKVMR